MLRMYKIIVGFMGVCLSGSWQTLPGNFAGLESYPPYI